MENKTNTSSFFFFKRDKIRLFLTILWFWIICLCLYQITKGEDLYLSKATKLNNFQNKCHVEHKRPTFPTKPSPAIEERITAVFPRIPV